MRVIDLTHTITQDMPVYPGSGTPRLALAGTYEKDGFKETLLQMSPPYRHAHGFALASVSQQDNARRIPRKPVYRQSPCYRLL